jgi:hypothetical protein
MPPDLSELTKLDFMPPDLLSNVFLFCHFCRSETPILICLLNLWRTDLGRSVVARRWGSKM